MARGRPRSRARNLPDHIDHTKLPKGLYWDPSGKGRWYVLDPHPDGHGGTKARTVAQASARLSELHAIADQRAGAPERGSINQILTSYHGSLEYSELAVTTRDHYQDYREAIAKHVLKNGLAFGDLLVDKLTPGGVRRVIHAIAMGRPAEKPGEKDVPGYPTKANHWLRYLRSATGWGFENDLCESNPFVGVKQVRERRDPRMPELSLFRAVQKFARERGGLGARAKGSLPAYQWAAMELAYQARLRGIEVLTMHDGLLLAERVQTNRRKGSKDNLVRRGSLMSEAIEALQAYRARVWQRRGLPTPLRPEHRTLLVSEDGTPLTRRGWNTAWTRLMKQAVAAGVLTKEQRFGLHGLKHRGITDSKGDKKRESGLTDSMVRRYDHELPDVEPAADP